MGRLTVFIAGCLLHVAGLQAQTLDSHLAGSWYPDSKAVLEKQIDGFIKNVKVKKLDNVIALLLPHAGYRYSGQVAAYGLAEIVGKSYERVIVLGPSHRVSMRDMLSIPQYKFYKTPLGKTELDLDFIEKLRKFPFVKMIDYAHENEHSVQIELPLLQYALKNKFKFVPVVVGQMSADGAQKVADALRPLLDKKTLVVVSSDFTHYGSNFMYKPFPLNNNTPANIRKLDFGAVDLIKTISPDKFRSYVYGKHITICGRGPIEILLRILPANAKTEMLAYDTSGRMTGSYASSVSYVCCAFTGNWDKQKEKPENTASKDTLSPESQKQLLKLARGTIAYYLNNSGLPAPKDIGVTITPDMEKVMGAFVTLHKKSGRLRGCIGEIQPRRALWSAVREQAFNAAFRDWRFTPLKPEELENIDIEISALTPPVPVKSYKEIVLGRDGIILTRGNRSAVFLPQVATEQSWNLAETLSNLSRKAGLPTDAWKEDGTTFKVFHACVFGEKHK